MSVTRRGVLLTAGGLVGCATGRSHRAGSASRIRAVAFDAFALFDPRPFARALEANFPGRGAALAAGHRARVFDYGWLRALGGRYEDFQRISEDALDAVAEAEGLDLAPPLRRALLAVWTSLPPWPDTVDEVRRLSRQGLGLAVLSNWSPGMIAGALERSGLDGMVRVLSSDAVRTYKPDPRAYQLAPSAFRVPRAEILFVAFAGWDAAGASWFGFPTVWMNRAEAAPDRLDMGDVPTVRSLVELAL